MSKSKHTPGPWFAVRNTAYWEVNPQRELGDENIPYTVADCCASDPGDTTGLQEANARLIAAAPELLEALERAELIVEDQEDNDLYKPGVVKRVLSDMRAAIAKATGQ